MKKDIFFILGSLFTSCAFASTSPFVGFYVTPGVGGITSHFQVSGNSALDSIIEPSYTFFNLNNKGKMYANKIIPSIGAGYAFCWRNFIIGIEGDVDFFYVLRTQRASQTMDNTDILQKTNIRVELRNSFEFLFRPGWLMDPWTLLYAIIGPKWGNFRVVQSARLHEQFIPEYALQPVIIDSKISNNRSHWKTGFTVGVGIEQNIIGNLNASLEYAYTNYRTISPPFPTSVKVLEEGEPVAILTNKTNRVKIFTNSLELKFFYNFN
jgi:opacity protein-like surface antigen